MTVSQYLAQKGFRLMVLLPPHLEVTGLHTRCRPIFYLGGSTVIIHLYKVTKFPAIAFLTLNLNAITQNDSV